MQFTDGAYQANNIIVTGRENISASAVECLKTVSHGRIAQESSSLG
jgi:hypothetical protein